MVEASVVHGGVEGGALDIWKGIVTTKFADFNGRARRKEYWTFILVNLGIFVVLGILAGVLGSISNALGIIFGIFIAVFGIAMFTPTLAAQVRRLHDSGKATWMIVFGFIPLLSIVLFVFMLLDSDKGTNEFGPSPKYGA